MKDWIDVKTKLPERGERVLIYSNLIGVQVGYLNFKNQWSFPCNYSERVLNITHWQHLPEFPKV